MGYNIINTNYYLVLGDCMICSNCGTKISTDSKFCYKCGNNI